MCWIISGAFMGGHLRLEKACQTCLEVVEQQRNILKFEDSKEPRTAQVF
jgi:hypothetical protein